MDVQITRDSNCRYAEARIVRDGHVIATIDTQYGVLALHRDVDAWPELGQPNRNGYYQAPTDWVDSARRVINDKPSPVIGVGDEHLAPSVDLEPDMTIPGMCSHCHTVCYGDCRA